MNIPEITWRAFIATGFCMLIGAILILLIGWKKKTNDVSALWKKYFVYLFLITGIYSTIIFGWSTVVFGMMLILGLIEVVHANDRGNKKWLSISFITTLIIFLSAGAGFMTFSFSDPIMQVKIYTYVIVFDGFSQLSGHLFGRTPLAPKISPAKTIEGAIGGMLMMSAIIFWIVRAAVIKCLFISAIAGSITLAGDLLASKYKRICGIKDYSHLIPGHGGILDRFDSFIALGAIYSVYSHFVAPLLHS